MPGTCERDSAQMNLWFCKTCPCKYVSGKQTIGHVIIYQILVTKTWLLWIHIFGLLLSSYNYHPCSERDYGNFGEKTYVYPVIGPIGIVERQIVHLAMLNIAFRLNYLIRSYMIVTGHWTDILEANFCKVHKAPILSNKM